MDKLCGVRMCVAWGCEWGQRHAPRLAVGHTGRITPRGVNNLVGTDRGGCNKYDIGGAGLVKSLSRPGGEAGSAPAPHICAWAEPLLPYRLHSTRNEVERVEKRRTHVTRRIQLQQRIGGSVVTGSVVRHCELTAARGNARPLFSCHRTFRLFTGSLLKSLHQRHVETIVANGTKASAHHKHYQRRRENARTEPRSVAASYLPFPRRGEAEVRIAAYAQV
ncbi:hypothetical protein SFRURICE_018707 [Spodoptera frugiperda]|nr:hypothetical protein SFRURICE_018707 [Spodoptera frugiperda]